LLMAAEILIAILILTLVIYAFVYYRDVAVTYEKSQISQETEKFNSQFTKYLGQELTIQEVVALVHLAQEYNANVDKNNTDKQAAKSATDATGNINKNKVEVRISQDAPYVSKGIYMPTGVMAHNENLTDETDEILIEIIKLNLFSHAPGEENKIRRIFDINKIMYNEEGRVYLILIRNWELVIWK